MDSRTSGSAVKTANDWVEYVGVRDQQPQRAVCKPLLKLRGRPPPLAYQTLEDYGLHQQPEHVDSHLARHPGPQRRTFAQAINDPRDRYNSLPAKPAR